MILMNPYNELFENQYFEIAKKKVSETNKTFIIDSCKKYFPPDLFPDDIDNFRFLILLPYKEIMKVYNYIILNTYRIMRKECFVKRKLTSNYKEYYKTYEQVRDSRLNNVKLNVRIVKESSLLTCPYCNRDYINCRSSDASGAQLDHFYNRSKFPIFSLCLYNLIPSCSNCNRIKSDKTVVIKSPFDTEVDFNKELSFTYELDENMASEIVIKSSEELRNNIEILKLKKAYKINNVDVQDLIDKAKAYNKTQDDEIISILRENHIEISDAEIKRIIFGRNINPNEFGKKPLSKLTYDILKELRII